MSNAWMLLAPLQYHSNCKRTALRKGPPVNHVSKLGHWNLFHSLSDQNKYRSVCNAWWVSTQNQTLSLSLFVDLSFYSPQYIVLISLAGCRATTALSFCPNRRISASCMEMLLSVYYVTGWTVMEQVATDGERWQGRWERWKREKASEQPSGPGFCHDVHRWTELIMPAKGKHIRPATSRSLSLLHWLIFPVPGLLFYL